IELAGISSMIILAISHPIIAPYVLIGMFCYFVGGWVVNRLSTMSESNWIGLGTIAGIATGVIVAFISPILLTPYIVSGLIVWLIWKGINSKAGDRN
ncbi:MAG: hypothetical protein ACRDL7_06735, partial [Gaiellaceae bacterium]